MDEDATRVEVLILVCGRIVRRDDAVDCPVHVYLSRELGDRRVVDAARFGANVEHFIPNW